MKKFAAAILFCAFLAGCFSSSLLVVDYYLHPGKYAATCINKARPAMHCNGKCQLMKKIKAEEKREAENRDNLERQIGRVLTADYAFFSIPRPPSHLITADTPGFFNDNRTCVLSRSIFHPPASVC